jgi:aspartyl protease family protein
MESQPAGRSMGRVMIGLAWVIALGALTWGFQEWLDDQRNPNREVKSAIVDGTLTVMLERNRYGHYQARGQINGKDVDFLIDTGATTVSVPADLAARLGLAPGPALQATTANGTVTAFMTRLTRVRVGAIELRDVAATINPGMKGNEVLLGMSFLKRVEFTQRGNTLTLKSGEG